MASESEVNQVKAHLEGVDEIWSDEKIGQTFDVVGSVSKTVRAFWQARVNETYRLLDISESGSSRAMSVIYRNAMEQLNRWEAKIAQEEADSADPVKGARIHRVTRKLPT